MRRKFTELDRRRFFVELDRSGESNWGVARRLGLTPTTAHRWVAAREDEGPTFALAVRSAAEAMPIGSGGVTIEVGGARIVVGSDFEPSLLRAVVAALAEVDW